MCYSALLYCQDSDIVINSKYLFNVTKQPVTTAASIRNTYSEVNNDSATSFKCCHVPISVATLVHFVAYLAETNIAYGTIKVYLIAVRQLHVSTGHHVKFNLQLTPCLQQILRRIKKHQATHNLSRTKRIIQTINGAMLMEPCSYSNRMIGAACSMAFFWFYEGRKIHHSSQRYFPSRIFQ